MTNILFAIFLIVIVLPCALSGTVFLFAWIWRVSGLEKQDDTKKHIMTKAKAQKRIKAINNNNQKGIF